MNELVFKGDGGKALTTSKLVAEKFGKRHSDVLRCIESVIAQTPKDQAERNFALSEYQDTSGKSNPMFVMTKDGFSVLVMGFTGEKAMTLKWNFINEFNKLETIIKFGGFAVPKTYSEALLLASKQAEKIEQQKILLLEQAPKVDFFDAVTDSKDAVDMAQCAKILNMGIGRNRLFEFLRSRGILDKNNIPFQRYIDCGYFRTIEQKYTKSDGSTCINIKTVIYQKGLAYIRKLINK